MVICPSYVVQLHAAWMYLLQFHEGVLSCMTCTSTQPSILPKWCKRVLKWMKTKGKLFLLDSTDLPSLHVTDYKKLGFIYKKFRWIQIQTSLCAKAVDLIVRYIPTIYSRSLVNCRIKWLCFPLLWVSIEFGTSSNGLVASSICWIIKQRPSLRTQMEFLSTTAVRLMTV